LSTQIPKFLGSNAFKYATQAAMQDSIKYQLCDVLSELGKSYPFTPKQLGYAPMLQEPRSLSNYRWLEKTDELVDVEGKHIDKNPKMLSMVPSGLVHIWGEEY
jgi:hypothetical protein